MKAFAAIAFAVVVALGTTLSAADDKKEKDKPKETAKEQTLNGTIVCAKCTLKEKGITKCTTAIQVKDGDKTVTYLFDDKGTKEKYHEDVCGSGVKKEGTVVGTVSEKDGKKWIKPTKVEYKKTDEKK